MVGDLFNKKDDNENNIILGEWVKTPKTTGLFPPIMKVAASTIGLDLVSVKPITSPKCELIYLNYSYKPLTRMEKLKIWMKNLFN